MVDGTRPPAPESDAELEAKMQRVHRVELGLSHVLRGGVATSSIIVFAGLVMMFVHHPEYITGVGADKVIVDMAFPHTLAEVFLGIARGEGRSIVIVGLFVLIATPV